jgi:site-specific recombinase XerD
MNEKLRRKIMNPPSIPLIALLDRYQREMIDLNGFSDKTLQTYLSCLESFFEYAQKDLKIDPLRCGGEDMLKWMRQVKERSISDSRLGHHRCAVRSFYSFLMRMGVRADDPSEFIPQVRNIPRGTTQPASAKEVFQLLQAIDTTTYEGLRDHLMIALLWALGLRASELLSLRRGDWKLMDKARQTGLLYIHGKGKKQRALFVVDRLFEEFYNFLYHPQTPRGKSALLFPGKNRGKLHGSSLLRRLEKYKAMAGLSARMTPHVLRHSFATEMYEAGVPLSAIQDMLGHRSITETALYIHVSQERQKAALSLLTLHGEIRWH